MDAHLIELIQSLGYIGVWITIMLESGVPAFFFLPGDSLLMTTGFLASQGYLNIATLTVGCFVAAVVGHIIGYEIGRRIGVQLYEKGDSRFIKMKHLERAQDFYNKYGHAMIVFARFVPVVRTLAPFIAGAVRMPYHKFIIYTVIGALIWTVSLCLIGFYFGDIVVGH